ncbi:MAG: tryptophan synthase subunit alpha [Bacteroidota bacterium]|nr:tryptophan synthase subunit alpha [Bacteroidota bacterium]
MNRIDTLFQQKKNNVLSVYFTAGHPELNSTASILGELEASGVEMVEIGMPFSDPLADGPVIQDSSSKALKNGMTLKLLFDQLKDIRKDVKIPLLLMGYINPVLQYGVENFCKKCRETGIDGVILPDLPMDIYEESFRKCFEDNGVHFIFLITPQTSDERIRMIDSISGGFIYMVSSAATTGAKSTIAEKQIEYFNRVKALNLKNPLVIGFGISNHETFASACRYANGAIIGSAFVKMLDKATDMKSDIRKFVKEVLG